MFLGINHNGNIYNVCIRPMIHGDIGLENTWAFFNLIFVTKFISLYSCLYLFVSKLSKTRVSMTRLLIDGVIAAR